MAKRTSVAPQRGLRLFGFCVECWKQWGIQDLYDFSIVLLKSSIFGLFPLGFSLETAIYTTITDSNVWCLPDYRVCVAHSCALLGWSMKRLNTKWKKKEKIYYYWSWVWLRMKYNNMSFKQEMLVPSEVDSMTSSIIGYRESSVIVKQDCQHRETVAVPIIYFNCFNMKLSQISLCHWFDAY